MTEDFKGKHLSPSTEFIKGQEAWNKGITGKDSHMYGLSHAGLRGKLNPKWKGNEKLTYQHLHKWIRQEYGSSSCCEICGTNNPTKRYECRIS